MRIMKQETKPSKSPEKTGIKAGRNEKGQFVKGVSGNPKGYPKGQKNFTTDFDEVVKEIAKANDITPNEARKVLLRRAYAEARDGNYNFYKDVCDRYYGKAHDIIEGDSGKPIIIQIAKEVAEKNNVINQSPK